MIYFCRFSDGKLPTGHASSWVKISADSAKEAVLLHAKGIRSCGFVYVFDELDSVIETFAVNSVVQYTAEKAVK